MDLPDDFTHSWRAIIHPGTSGQITLSRRTQCCIAGVGLEQAKLPATGKVSLFVSVNRSPPVAIASLIVGRAEAVPLDIRFGFGDIIVFTLSGTPHPVHVYGLATGGSTIQVVT
jgi:hypothetical protein